jgi:adenine deaminase
MHELTSADFALRESGSKKRVIEMVPGELLTREVIVPAALSRASELAFDGHIVPSPGVETDKDIIKLAVVERHKNKGHVGVGFARGYGIRYGAIASSVAHDSHNLIIAGTNDVDMAVAGNAVRSNLGGLAIAVDGEVVCSLPLPLGGLMCDKDAAYVESVLSEMKDQARLMGVPSGIDPFMTLAFTALPVIPKLRILTQGMFDVDTQSYVPALFD